MLSREKEEGGVFFVFDGVVERVEVVRAHGKGRGKGKGQWVRGGLGAQCSILPKHPVGYKYTPNNHQSKSSIQNVDVR